VERTEKYKMPLLSDTEKELVSWILTQRDSKGALAQMAMKKGKYYERQSNYSKTNAAYCII
jgi:hypothetical protein